MKVSGDELVNSIPGENLMAMAVLKYFREGKTHSEIMKEADELAWEIENLIKKGDL